LIVLVPHGSDHVPGFFDSVRTIKQMAKRLGASIVGYAAAPETEPYAEHFAAVRPEVDTTFEHVASWDAVLNLLPSILRADDVAVVIGARQGAVSWDAGLDRLPGTLATLVPESFVMLYPEEFREAVAPPATPKPPHAGYAPAPPRSRRAASCATSRRRRSRSWCARRSSGSSRKNAIG
jgi:hypothetical protein